ncbi:MAG TPA: DUF58 domain-containing protein [Chitinispirillaceae bacterium]|nr:DUF58 domain-containing protein [Chitinispirillaceae bacterium]
MKNLTLITPRDAAHIKNLSIRAKCIVEGTIAGLHKSPYHGFSAEFLEYRSYFQGESIRKIDWRKFAKSERAVVRLFEDETNLSANILLDKSASMCFKSDAALNKFEYAQTLAAAIARIFIAQRDAVGLAMFDASLGVLLPPKSTNIQMELILKALEQAEPSDATCCASAIESLAVKIRKRGMTILISDLFDDPEEIIRGLRHLKFVKQDVIVLWILDPFEHAFKDAASYRLSDLESGRELLLDGNTASRYFREGLDRHKNILVNACKELRIDLELVSTDEPFHRALLRVLEKRRHHF